MKVKSIGEEIKQAHFASASQKVAVNLMFTVKEMELRVSNFLKRYDLTEAQFNVLRILRGQKGNPASVKLIMERMLDKSSNVSRLLDKLVKKEWVERRECPNDRRQVDVIISEKGIEILETIDKATEAISAGNGSMSDDELTQLSDLLDKWRAFNN